GDSAEGGGGQCESSAGAIECAGGDQFGRGDAGEDGGGDSAGAGDPERFSEDELGERGFFIAAAGCDHRDGVGGGEGAAGESWNPESCAAGTGGEGEGDEGGCGGGELFFERERGEGGDVGGEEFAGAAGDL